jgi:ketosteroid isomerase-like protein
MRSPILLIVFVFAVANSSVLATEKDIAEIEIRAVMNAQVAAWNRGDIDGYMDGYVRSDKLEFVSKGKITRGWQTVRDRYHKKYNSRDAMGTLKFSDIKIRLLRYNLALVIGRWELSRKSDRPHGSFVLTFRHQREGWRIVHDETE